MFRIHFILLLVFALAIPGSLYAQTTPSVTATLGSSFVVEGERTLLTVELSGIQTIGWPTSPKVSPLTLREEGQGHIQRNGRIREVYQYTISSIRPGLFTIPPFEVVSNRGTARSEPLTLRVYPADSLSINGLRVDSTTLPYLTGIYLEKESPYLGEPQNVEAKLYLPSGQPHFLNMRFPMMADLEKNGIGAWRFDGTREPSGVLEREGIVFNVFTYHSSVTPLQEGALTLGPGKANPVLRRRTQSRGRFVIREEPLEFKFPSKSFEARPLPRPAPEGFDGAVGNFSISATPLNRELELGDTVTVELEVVGTGNIDQLSGPRLVDPKGDWKQFEISPVAQGSERRSTSGTVKFTQVIRPNKKVPELAPYHFVFFDPLLEEYRTVKSLPQKLIITGDALSLDDDTNSEALAFLPASGRPLKTIAKDPGTPAWAWQLVPGLIVLGLIAVRLKRSIASKQMASLPAREFEAELKEIGDLSGDRVKFYRSASNFVTRWKGDKGFEEVHETSDAIGYAPKSEPVPLPATEKNRILNLLRQLSPLLLIGFILALQTGRSFALPQDTKQAREEILEAMTTSPSPEDYHNLALCEEALENPGAAALAAYRFQLHDGEADEILGRLPGTRAFERKGTNWVSIIPLTVYQQALFAGLWALLILVLLIVAFPNRRIRWPLPLLEVISGLGLTIGISGWLLYPDDISFKPLRELSVVTANSPIQRQPYEGGEPIRDEVVGSLCYVDASPGEWAHIELPGGLKGWVPKSAVTPIVE